VELFAGGVILVEHDHPGVIRCLRPE
jgi:hypothetical protein